MSDPLPERRSYSRQPTDKRRDDLIAAALELVGEGGLPSATVRAIADRAGVTPGLIRHYFASKEDLLRDAFRQFMDRMTDDNADALDDALPDPAARLAAFVASSLRPPVMGRDQIGLWAGFLHDVLRDAAMMEVHRASYLGYRDLLQSLIAALPRQRSPAQLRADAIACNAVIDGLWLEGSVTPEIFAAGELEHIGLTAIGAVLATDLLAAALRVKST